MSKNFKTINILGIDVSIVQRSRLEAAIDSYLSGDKPVMITTPNPEIILDARRDRELRDILNGTGCGGLDSRIFAAKIGTGSCRGDDTPDSKQGTGQGDFRL